MERRKGMASLTYYIEQAGKLVNELHRIQEFDSEFRIIPPKSGRDLVRKMNELADEIKVRESAENFEEALLREMKRRLEGEAFYLDSQVGGKTYDYDTVIGLLHIPREDLDALHPWLTSNRPKAQEAVERIYK